MSKLTIVAYGIAREILGTSAFELHIHDQASIADIKTVLIHKFPKLAALRSLRFAVNEQYQADDFIVKSGSEVVIIPPVSGG